jgi:hypothetical protein
VPGLRFLLSLLASRAVGHEAECSLCGDLRARTSGDQLYRIEAQMQDSKSASLHSIHSNDPTAVQRSITKKRDDEKRQERLTIAIELPFKSVFPSGVATVPEDERREGSRNAGREK